MLTAWQNNSHTHPLGICSSASPGAVNHAGFNSSYTEGLPPGLSGNIYGSVSGAQFMLFYLPPVFATNTKICICELCLRIHVLVSESKSTQLVFIQLVIDLCTQAVT